MRLFVLGLLLAPPIQAQSLELGQFRQSHYHAVRLDPADYRFEVLTYGRSGTGWTSAYGALEDIPRDWPVALNGTFFSLRTCQPAGVLVYGEGRQEWSPRFSRPYDNGERPVVSLARWYAAFYRNGQVRLGNSRGRSCAQLRPTLEPPALECLLGGGGSLVHQGRRALALKQERFDERSGLRPEAAVPRTGLGLDARGQVLLLTVGLNGPGLPLTDFADLFLQLGARQAIFLDCGGSTALRVGTWQRGGGRSLPTWLVARRRDPRPASL